MVLLLAPMMALAQGMPTSDDSMNHQVTHSPLLWSWVVMLAVAIVAFVLYTVSISRHRRPPDRPVAP